MRDELKCLLHGRCDVKVVGDGDAALASLRDDAPDLVLAGVSMPFLDGLGLLRAIRAHPATRSIPVILLAAWDGEADRDEVFECGADDYLAKPFGVRELSARVATHVELARLRKEMAGRTTAVESIRHGAELSHAILSSLRDHVAVLDEDGVIIAVNEAWARSTGDRGLVGTSYVGVGDNYLEVCRRAAVDPADSASRALAGIGAVLAGAMPYFELEYAGVSPTEQRWFVMTVTPFKKPEGGVVVVHREITDRRRLREAIEERLGFETLVTDLTVNFVNLPLDRIDEAIEQALARIAQHLEVDQVLLGEFTAEGTAPRVTHAYNGLGILPGPEEFLLRESSPCVTLLRGGEPVVFSTLPDDLPRDAVRERANWPEQGLKSLLAIPLIVGGTVVGLLAIASCRSDRSWPEALSQRLRLLGGIFAAALQRQRAEEALREIEGRLARAEDSALVMTTHVGLDGRWLKVPPTLCLLLGYTEEELLASSFKDVTHPDDFEADWSQRQRLIRGEIRSFDLEQRYIRKDGRIIWVYLNCSIVTDVGGQPVHFLTYLRDITGRKWAEEMQARLADILEATPDLVSSATSDGRVIYFNQEARRVLGLPEEGAFGDWPISRGLPDWANRIVQEEGIPAAIRDGSWSGETAVLGHEGREIPVSQVIIAHRDPGGGTLCLSSIARDITERKRTEEALRESEERFRGTFENAAVGIAHTDGEGRFLRVNEKLCDIVGYTRAELLARTFRDITYPEDLAASLEQFSPLMRGESASFSLEKRYLRKDGSLVWGHVSVSLQRDAAGKPAYAIAILQDISERKRAEEALRLANARLDLAVRGSNIGIWENDMPDGVVQKGRVDLTNIFEQLGYDRPELPTNLARGMSLVHPDDRERVERATQAYLSGETSEYEVEHRVRHKDGSDRWMLTRGVAMRDAAGRPIRFIGSCIDITDYRRAVEAQRRLQRERDELLARLQLQFEGMPIGCVIADPGLRIIDWNPAAEKIFGYRREEVLGVDATLLLVPPARRDAAQGLYRRLASGETTEHAVNEYVTKDGRTILCEWCTTPLRDADGEVIALLGMAQDVTERQRAEEALRESEERFRLMADGAPVMIWMSGADGLCTYFNQVWLDYTGRPMQAEVGDGWTEDVHRDDLQGCLDTYLRAFEARRRFTMEYRLRRYDGEYRWVLDTGVARFERDGRFAGYIGSCIDISERKRAEEALRTSEQSLRRSRREHRILAGRLLQAQEVERQRVARELHDDLTQRLAALAIEVGSLEQRVDRSGAIAGALNGIREQLVKLSEDVHALSRQLHPAILDDLGLVDALRSECLCFTQREGIAVTYRPGRIPEDLPKDVALCFYRIAQEALRNIAKHARAGRARVVLAGTDGDLILTVADSGVGFDPSRARERPGLGLASMKERARLIRAELSIRTQPGLGTTIVVKVPLSGVRDEEA